MESSDEDGNIINQQRNAYDAMDRFDKMHGGGHESSDSDGGQREEYGVVP